MSKGSEPAYPWMKINITTREINSGGGMTLRQWYAGMALQGWIASMCNGETDDYDKDGMEIAFAQHQAAVAKTCCGYADAMIAELERTK